MPQVSHVFQNLSICFLLSFSYCAEHEWEVHQFTPGKYSIFSAEEDQSCGEEEEEGGGGGGERGEEEEKLERKSGEVAGVKTVEEPATSSPPYKPISPPTKVSLGMYYYI